MAKKQVTVRDAKSGRGSKSASSNRSTAASTPDKRSPDHVAASAAPTEDSHTLSVKSGESERPGGTIVTNPPVKVLDVFYIDSGWNNSVCAAIRENLPAVAEYLQGHRFFVMSPQQSMEFIRRHPGLIGEDPLLLVLDRATAAGKDPKRSCGFRLCLGSVKNPETAVSMLKWAIQLTMTANTSEMASIISKSAHRESFQGVVELMGEGSTHLIEFAPI